MIELTVRWGMVVVIFAVNLYYLYLLMNSLRLIRNKDIRNHMDEKNEILLKKKIIPTICYMTGMLIIALLYLLKVDVGVLSNILMLSCIIVGLIGNKYILAKSDLKQCL